MHDVATLAPERGNDIVLARLFDAPRETVWDAFTDAGALAAWWGPDGCTIETRHADIKEGGEWRYAMKTPSGKSFENGHKYEQITRPERIVYRQGERPEDDNAVRVTVDFAPRGTATLVTIRIEFSSKAWRDKLMPGAIMYPAQSLTHLAAYLAKSRKGDDHG